MPVTKKMLASDLMMCALKKVPWFGVAVEVVDVIKVRYEQTLHADRLAGVEEKLTRVEERMRNVVVEEMRSILETLRKPDLNGAALTEEIRNFRQIQEQGWHPSLFEGLLQNSSHLQELKRNPQIYGKILNDHDKVDPSNGIHLLLDADKSRILEITPFAFSQLLANQPKGVPEAKIQAAADVWAFPSAQSGLILPSGSSSLTNSVGMTFARIPAGTFMMGSPLSDRDASDDEKPQHEVTISKPFELAIHPVTQGQYRAVTGQSPSHFKGEDSLPVENVSWLDAVEYCNALSRKEKRTPFYAISGTTVTVPNWNANGNRLPTEAEWEYACRAGSETRFSFLDERAIGEYAWYSENSGGKVHPVGLKKPNSFGLYDMHGNVWEWCWDGYEAYKGSPVIDPRGPSQAPNRVDRGGSWYGTAGFARAAYRAGLQPGDRYGSLGFRVARVQS